MRPEDALAAAEAEAARRRASGGYAAELAPDAMLAGGGAITRERLLEWALIEPDLTLVRSTRRLGAPITWAKRGLVRALRQHHGQAFAQQTRFNLHLAAAWIELEERVARLEEREDAR